jgi:hypothetical protein
MRNLFEELRDWGKELYKTYLEPHGLVQVEWSSCYVSDEWHPPDALYHLYKGVVNRLGLALYYKEERHEDEFRLMGCGDIIPRFFIPFIESFENGIKEQVSQVVNGGVPARKKLLHALDKARGSRAKK